LLHRLVNGLGDFEQSRLGGERSVAADAIDRTVARGRHQPGTGIGRRPLVSPALGGDRKGLLGGFLGEVEIAEEADQGRQDATPLVVKGALEDR
jgi:hypothetical protein